MAWHPHGNKRMMPMGHHGYREKSTFMDQEPRWLDNPDNIPIYHDRGMERRRSPKEWYEEDRDVHRQWDRRSASRAPEYSEEDHYRHQMPRGRPWANNTPSSAMPFDARTVRNTARGGSGDGGGVRDRSFSPHERGDDLRRSYSPNNDSYEPGPGRWTSGRSYERERLPPLLPGGRSIAGDRRSVSPPPYFQGRPSFTEWDDAPGRLKHARPGPKRRRSPLLVHPKAYRSTLPAAGHAVGVSSKPHTVTRQSKGKSAEPPKTKLGFRSPTASPKVLDAAQPPTQSGPSNSSLAAEEAVSSAVTQAAVAQAVKNASPKPSDWTERTNLADMVVGADACVGLSFPTNGVPKDHPTEAFGPTFLQKFGPKGDEDKGRAKFAESSVAGKSREARPATDAAGGAPPEPVMWNCGKRSAAVASGGIPFLSSTLQEQQQQQQQDSPNSPAMRGVGKPLCRGGLAEISPSSDEPAAARLEKKASVGPAAGPSDGAVGSSVASPPVGIGDAEAAAMGVKEPEGEKHLDPVDEEVLKKRREIEQTYREDCETFCTVVRMLVDKDPSLENAVQASLRANIVEMGQQSLEQLRNFVASRKRLRSSKEHSPALPQVWPAP